MTIETKWVKIERSFAAPIETVWKMWTDPDMFKRWYGPNGASIPVAEMDVVVGGRRKICMEMNMGGKTMTMWFCGEYREVVTPSRLVYTESMCDADGNMLSPKDMGMPEDHPEVTEIVVELSGARGQTHMTMYHIGVPAGSPGAGGWNMAFDKLAAIFTSN